MEVAALRTFVTEAMSWWFAAGRTGVHRVVQGLRLFSEHPPSLGPAQSAAVYTPSRGFLFIKYLIKILKSLLVLRTDVLVILYLIDLLDRLAALLRRVHIRIIHKVI